MLLIWARLPAENIHEYPLSSLGNRVVIRMRVVHNLDLNNPRLVFCLHR